MNPLPAIKHTRDMIDFIDEDYLHGLLSEMHTDKARFREIVAKSLDKNALTLEETAVLLTAEGEELNEELFEAARQLKANVYGDRVVLFAPLYIGNSCVNDCRYCSFRRSNRNAVRRTLGLDEIEKQVTALEDKGHKRLILVFGEHPKYSPEFIAKCVEKVYGVRSGHGEIRRVNINAAPLDVEGFRTVKEAGIGTYQVFQETYHRETYRRMHPEGTRKGDFLYRLDSLDRAMTAGCDDVGIGALFGLYDWKYEVLGLVRHALHLQERFGVGPHTISFPRIRPASNVEFDDKYVVNDDDFKRLVAILRLAVPYTGLICTAREEPAIRREVMRFGVSQIDAGSRIEIGGYTEAGDAQIMEREQFSLGDIRPLDTVMRELLEDGYIPSFCTACYRLGRTGEHFMEFAIPGFINRFCTPNALTTLTEYLTDYASCETKVVGGRVVTEKLTQIEREKLREKTKERIERIKTSDDRDLYF